MDRSGFGWARINSPQFVSHFNHSYAAEECPGREAHAAAMAAVDHGLRLYVDGPW